MEWEDVRQRIDAIADYDAFVDLALMLRRADQTELFNFLFPCAISGGRGSWVAACLLVELDPKPRRTCEQLLAEVALSRWNVSVTEIPFYFISRFGKDNLKASYASFIAGSSLTNEQKQRVSTILYWTGSPTAELIRSYHDWPWREADNEAAA